MNASHDIKDIPSHRVVNRIGLLSGKNHFFGKNLMQQLLESEGIEIKNDKVVNFENIFWDPSSAVVVPPHRQINHRLGLTYIMISNKKL